MNAICKATGKIKHRTIDDAAAHVERLRTERSEHRARHQRIAIYRCRYCKRLHVGHRPPPPRRRGRWKARTPQQPVGPMRIHIENFQSLGQVDVEAEGLTVLVGPSDRGKSALVRAVEAALFNRPGDAFVRHGATHAIVELTDVPGVDGKPHHVRWRKGKSTNEFILDGDKHARVGVTAPSQLATWGYRDVWVGDKDRKKGESIRPQVGNQFDPLFLLTRAGSFIADVLNLVTRHTVLQTATGRAASDLTKAKQKAGTLEKLLAEAEPITAALADVPALVERIEALAATQEALERRQQTVARLKMLTQWRRQMLPLTASVPAPTRLQIADRIAAVARLRIKQRLVPLTARVDRRYFPAYFRMLADKITAVGRYRQRQTIAPVTQLTLPAHTVVAPVAIGALTSVRGKVEAWRVARTVAESTVPATDPVREGRMAVFQKGCALHERAAGWTGALRQALDNQFKQQGALTGAITMVDEAQAQLAAWRAVHPLCPSCDRPWSEEACTA